MIRWSGLAARALETLWQSFPAQSMTAIDVIQTLLLVVSAALVVHQLRQTTKLAKAANAQSLVAHAGTLNTLLMENAELAAIWYARGQATPEVAGPMQQERYREMLVQWLIFHENIFHQKQQKLLDPIIYQSWDRDLASTAREHDLSVVAEDLCAFFPGKFGEHLVDLRSRGSFQAGP